MFYMSLSKNTSGFLYFWGMSVKYETENWDFFDGERYLLYSRALLLYSVSLKGINKLVACPWHEKTFDN